MKRNQQLINVLLKAVEKSKIEKKLGKYISGDLT